MYNNQTVNNDKINYNPQHSKNAKFFLDLDDTTNKSRY